MSWTSQKINPFNNSSLNKCSFKTNWATWLNPKTWTSNKWINSPVSSNSSLSRTWCSNLSKCNNHNFKTRFLSSSPPLEVNCLLLRKNKKIAIEPPIINKLFPNYSSLSSIKTSNNNPRIWCSNNKCLAWINKCKCLPNLNRCYSNNSSYSHSLSNGPSLRINTRNILIPMCSRFNWVCFRMKPKSQLEILFSVIAAKPSSIRWVRLKKPKPKNNRCGSANSVTLRTMLIWNLRRSPSLMRSTIF